VSVSWNWYGKSEGADMGASESGVRVYTTTGEYITYFFIYLNEKLWETIIANLVFSLYEINSGNSNI